MEFQIADRPTINVHSKTRKEVETFSSSANAEVRLECVGDQTLLINRKYRIAPRSLTRQASGTTAEISIFLVLKLTESVEGALPPVMDLRRSSPVKPVGTLEFVSISNESSLTYTCYLENNTFWQTLELLASPKLTVIFKAHALNIDYDDGPDGRGLIWEVEGDSESSADLEDIRFLDTFRFTFQPEDRKPL